MLSPKQKAYLKGLNYLAKHELMKISLLNNTSVSFEEAMSFFEAADIEIVQKIGRVLVLYRPSNTVDQPIVLP